MNRKILDLIARRGMMKIEYDECKRCRHTNIILDGLCEDCHSELGTEPAVEESDLVDKAPNELYEKYKHLDDLLSDKKWLPDDLVGQILFECWRAIKEGCTEKERTPNA